LRGDRRAGAPRRDLAHLLVEQVLREAFARAAPLDLLLGDRDVLEVRLERLVAQRLGHVADAAVPADRRDAPAEVLVDPLGPHAHLRAVVGSSGRSLTAVGCASSRYSQITVLSVTIRPPSSSAGTCPRGLIALNQSL
jgi:hypothetical protein